MYQLSVFLHVLAAAIWVGGIFFISLVVLPAVRGLPPAERGALISAVGRRFRTVGWASIVLLVATGLANLIFRGVTWENWTMVLLTTDFGRILSVKLGVFVVMIGLSALHDFVLGPASVRALERPESKPAEVPRLRRRSSWLARIVGLLALVVVALGVLLVRGVPTGT